MTETWADLQWFASVVGGSSSGATQVVDVGELGTSATPWSGSSSSSGGSSGSSETATTEDSTATDPTGGTGSTPTISIGTDYWLRDENNEVITDENGEGYSLEGAL